MSVPVGVAPRWPPPKSGAQRASFGWASTMERSCRSRPFGVPSGAHSTASRSRSASRISGSSESRPAAARTAERRRCSRSCSSSSADAALGLGQPLGDALLVGELRVLGRLLGFGESLVLGAVPRLGPAQLLRALAGVSPYPAARCRSRRSRPPPGPVARPPPGRGSRCPPGAAPRVRLGPVRARGLCWHRRSRLLSLSTVVLFGVRGRHPWPGRRRRGLRRCLPLRDGLEEGPGLLDPADGLDELGHPGLWVSCLLARRRGRACGRSARRCSRAARGRSRRR